MDLERLRGNAKNRGTSITSTREGHASGGLEFNGDTEEDGRAVSDHNGSREGTSLGKFVIRLNPAIKRNTTTVECNGFLINLMTSRTSGRVVKRNGVGQDLVSSDFQ